MTIQLKSKALVRVAPTVTSPSGAISSGASDQKPAQPAPTAATSTESAGPSVAVVVGGFVSVGVVAAVTLALTNGFPYSKSPPTPVAGVTIFAVFFVAAQGIERLLEPIAALCSSSSRDELIEAMTDAQNAVDAAAAAPGANPDAASDAGDKLKVAANKKAAHQASQANRSVAFWALASSVAIVASAVLKLYLLTAVGIAAPGRVLDVIATGLIIGAGTKPLHDLITLLSAKKDAASG